MAPEQALSTKHADARADIYSLGCSLYLPAHRQGHLRRRYVDGQALAHREKPIPSLGADVPEQVQAVFEKMVAKNVEDRYQTMTEVVAALEQCDSGQATSLSLQQSVGTGSSSDVMTFLRNATLNTIAKSKATPTARATAGNRAKNSRTFVRGAVCVGLLGLTVVAGVIFKMRDTDGTSVPVPVKKNVAAAAPDFALEFDGKTRYVTTPIRYDGSHPLTVEALVVQRQNDDGTHYIIGDSESGGIHLMIRKGLFEMGYRASSGPLVVVTSAGPAVANRMVHVAGVIEGNEVRLFVDGVLQGATSGAKLKVSPVSMAIGTNPPSAFEVFDGLIDEVRISKIARYRDSFTPVRRFAPDADTIALYHFDEGSGDTALDASGHGNDATIVAAKWLKADSLVPWEPGPVASPTDLVQGNKPWNTPAFQQWMKEVRAMPAKEQVEAVSKKLMELNPGFDGKVIGWNGSAIPRIENGVVTALGFVTDNVTDVSPVRALPGLTTLKCAGSGMGNAGTGKVADLSPLHGLPLVALDCGHNPVSNLSPLAGMKLTELRRGDTKVSDLSPLEGMPMTDLMLQITKVSDLSPLHGMPLTNLTLQITSVSDLTPLEGMNLIDVSFTPGSITKGLDILRQMKSLSAIRSGTPGAQRLPPTEFWRKYEAGEFGKPTVSNQPWNTPAFQAWIREAQVMPAEEQVKAVSKKLMELNPGFDGVVTGFDGKSRPEDRIRCGH